MGLIETSRAWYVEPEKLSPIGRMEFILVSLGKDSEGHSA